VNEQLLDNKCGKLPYYLKKKVERSDQLKYFYAHLKKVLVTYAPTQYILLITASRESDFIENLVQ